MKLTIIPTDGSVGKDGVFYVDLDLSSCAIPENIHAFQWDGAAGWIEYKSALVQNQDITELPVWANACVSKWDEFKAAEEAEEQAQIAAHQARIAAQQAQQTEQ
jgi:hypothetical protein